MERLRKENRDIKIDEETFLGKIIITTNDGDVQNKISNS